MPGSSLADEMLRAMKAYVVPGDASMAKSSLSDVQRQYFWKKAGNALPVPGKDTTELKRNYWAANGGSPGGAGYAGPTGIKNFSVTGNSCGAVLYSFTPLVQTVVTGFTFQTETGAGGSLTIGISAALAANGDAQIPLTSVTMAIASDTTYTNIACAPVTLAAGTTYYLYAFGVGTNRSLCRATDAVADNATMVHWGYVATFSSGAWSAPLDGTFAACMRLVSSGSGYPGSNSSGLSNDDMELAFYRANGVATGKTLNDSALAYWSGQ